MILASYLKTLCLTLGHIYFLLCFILMFIVIYFPFGFFWAFFFLLYKVCNLDQGSFFLPSFLPPSPLHCFCAFVKKNQLVIFVWVYFWTVCLICVSMPLPTPHCVGYCSFKVNLKIEWYNSSNFSGLLQNCFSYSSSFAFQNKCEDQLVHILKKSC